MQQNKIKVNSNVKKIVAMSLVAVLSSGNCAFHVNAQANEYDQVYSNDESSESGSGNKSSEGSNSSEENIDNQLFTSRLTTAFRGPAGNITEEERAHYESEWPDAQLNNEAREEILGSVYRRNNDENPEETLNSDTNVEENSQRRGVFQIARNLLLALFRPCFKGVFGSSN